MPKDYCPLNTRSLLLLSVYASLFQDQQYADPHENNPTPRPDGEQEVGGDSHPASHRPTTPEMTKNEGDPLPEKEPIPWDSPEEDTYCDLEPYEYTPGVDNPGFVGDNRPRPGNETSTEVPEVPEVVIDAASSADGEIEEEGKKFSGINAGNLCVCISYAYIQWNL